MVQDGASIAGSHGEIFLKGDNRPQFINALARRVRYAIWPLHGRLELAQGRMYVKGVQDMDLCVDKVTKVFGVHSVSPALEVEKGPGRHRAGGHRDDQGPQR